MAAEEAGVMTALLAATPPPKPGSLHATLGWSVGRLGGGKARCVPDLLQACTVDGMAKEAMQEVRGALEACGAVRAAVAAGDVGGLVLAQWLTALVQGRG